jgi:hypothetical protein
MVKKGKLVPDELSPEQRHLVNKRLTMNILIQGAASHAHLSAHYLVRAELDEINTELVPLYDRSIAGATYAYWRGFLSLIMGRSNRFWGRMNRPSHPFFYHRFLRRHGRTLADEAFKTAKARCQEKGVPTGMYRHEFAIMKDILQTVELEREHRPRLEELAKQTCEQIIGTPQHLMNATITETPAWGNVRTPQTVKGKIIQKAMVGWGGVDRIDGQLQVVAKAIVWPLLLHELVKGSMELICLHGMNDMPADDFNVVMDYTEHLEYEVPMIQMGPEFHKRFLKVVPQDKPLADCVMAVSLMEPVALEEFLFDMIEAPATAIQTLVDALSSEQ